MLMMLVLRHSNHCTKIDTASLGCGGGYSASGTLELLTNIAAEKPFDPHSVSESFGARNSRK